MSYVETILDPDERITYRAFLHWIIFVRGGVMLFIGFLMLSAQGAAATIGLILFLLGILDVLRAAIDRWTTEIAVTDQRIIWKSGWIRRDTIEINMRKVESVDVQQSVLGRLLDFGTVIVRGTGGSPNPLACVSEPLPLRRSVTLAARSAPII
jgi:uncharacterized membrane protein YdbT with pleckstrin-like domain